ncbi:MAG: hypothetical protein HY244_10030 [Rhizobiales bacterium]|nr:hypothetical protein [Hyphomicrobiales bacterium]
MDSKRALTCQRKTSAARSAVTCLFAGGMVLMAALAAAQESAPAANPNQDTGFFAAIGRWFDRQSDNMNSTFGDARKKIENFGRDAGSAAQSTAAGARDAADAVVRIPNARVVRGHEVCAKAPNGAPDCVTAAVTMCKAKGFESGKSMDMTTAQVCPPKVLLSGRNSGPECRDETFVSRALCQ